MTTARSVPTPVIIAASIAAAAAIGVAGAFADGGWTKEGAHEAARLTARTSFPIFILAWSASALARLWPGGWRGVLLRRRRAIGLAFAGAHGVHLIALLIVVLVFRDPPAWTTLIGGSLGYVLVAAMAFTSHDAAVRALGPRNWRCCTRQGAMPSPGFSLSPIMDACKSSLGLRSQRWRCSAWLWRCASPPGSRRARAAASAFRARSSSAQAPGRLPPLSAAAHARGRACR